MAQGMTQAMRAGAAFVCAAAMLVGGGAEAKRKAPELSSSGEPLRPAKTVPQLQKAPVIDGALKEWKGALTVTSSPGEKAKDATFTSQVGWRGDSLFLGLEIPAERVPEGTVQAEVALHFTDAGVTAGGHVWRLGAGGALPGSGEARLPEFAHALTKVAVDADGVGPLRMELEIPARALPRFPARDALIFDLCVKVGEVSNCEGGTMKGDALRLPDDFRKGLKLALGLAEQVVGIEGREQGWVGYALLHHPVWIQADFPLTVQSLRSFVAREEKLADAKEAGINLPDELLLPGGGRVISVLTGKNPYVKAGECDGDSELRFGLYVVQDRAASKVLEWPAATCALGRAVAFDLSEDGELSIGYTNGASVSFQWFKDHFERTEIGARQ